MLKTVALEWSHKDPADRVIVALAKKYHAGLVTGDKSVFPHFRM